MAFPFSLMQLHMFRTDLLPKGVAESLAIRQQDKTNVRVIGPPLVFGQLYRLWGGNKPPIAWNEMNIWRCIYSFGECTPQSAAGYCATDTPTTLDYSLSAVYTGLSSHTKVEVTHRLGDPVGSGMWFYFARGSGIYYVRAGPLFS